jgi:biopolymer transport protein ExbD
MITRPFNFESHLTPPRSGIDLLPLINVCVLLLFFALLGSRFVLAPGTAMKLQLPTTTGHPPDALATSRVLTVGEVEGREMLIFEGRILNLVSFERHLRERADIYRGEVLLVRMDRDVSMELLVRVTALAREGGFSDILVAAEPEQAVPASGLGVLE